MKKTARQWLKKKCLPCEGGGASLKPAEIVRYLRGLRDWRLSGDGKFIRTEYRMKHFAEAIRLINRCAVIAEKEGHHPDIHLTGYRNLRIDLSTHAIGGLSENDFILAAKIEQIPKKLKQS